MTASIFRRDARRRAPQPIPEADASQDDLAVLARAITADLRHLGIHFDQRVPVDLAADLGQPHLLGLTTSTVWLHGDARSVTSRIAIRRDLDGAELGAVICHEGGHAWLHQRGIGLGEAALDEGFCNWIAVSWLRFKATPAHRSVAQAYLRNPDPVYGEGLRRIVSVAERTGPRALLSHVADFGQLPRTA